MKYIELRHYYIRDLIQKEKLDIEYLSTKEQLADIMTKILVKESL